MLRQENTKSRIHRLRKTMSLAGYYMASKNELLSKILVFKGGTVLKKTYFEDYRFSEDLDFTLMDEKISNEDLLKEFEKVYAFVKEESNITLQFKESDTH